MSDRSYAIIALGVMLTSSVALRADDHLEGDRTRQQNTQNRTHHPLIVEPAFVFAGAPTETTRGELNNTAQRAPANADEAPWIVWSDTSAQWLMMLTGIIAAGLSGWAVWLLRQTLVATRDAVRSADDAVAATRQLGEAQVRAYISISPRESHQIIGGGIFPLDLFARNTGQSPAREFRYVAAAFIETFPLPLLMDDLVKPYFSKFARGGTLSSGKEITIEAYGDPETTIAAIIDATASTDRKMYVACVAEYRDVFDQPRASRFCAYLINDGAIWTGVATVAKYRWVLTDQHNDET